MRTRNLLIFGLIGACAGTSGCSSAPPTADARAEVRAEAGEAEATADLDKLVAEAARGLSRVTKDGVEYFCRRERPMGSNISRLKCLTEAQLRVEVETMVKYRDDLRNRSGKCTAGRAGQGGPCGAL